MNEKEKNVGYWVYSTIAVLAGFGLLFLFGFMIYDLILKLATQDFSNNTVIQALITLVVTVFIGGYFSKWLELRNTKKLETYKIQSQLALTIVDLASAYIYSPDDEQLQRALVRESSKVKLFFDDETLKKLNEFINAEDKKATYDPIVDCLKKKIK